MPLLEDPEFHISKRIWLIFLPIALPPTRSSRVEFTLLTFQPLYFILQITLQYKVNAQE